MKKIIITLAVLLLATPAMALVTITVEAGPGPNDVTIGFTSDEDPGKLVRAIALDVQVSDANVVIADVNCINVDYKIHPGSIAIDAGGNVTDYGTCAGAGLDTGTMSSEQGSLYIGAANAPVEGDLFIVTLANCTAVADGNVVVSVSENQLRGGVVMEDAGPAASVDVSATATVTVGNCCSLPDCCTTCKGDLDGNGWIMVPDMFMLMGKLGAAGAPYTIPLGDPLYQDCGDMDGNKWIMVPDYFMLLGMLGGAGAPYTIPCPP